MCEDLIRIAGLEAGGVVEVEMMEAGASCKVTASGEATVRPTKGRGGLCSASAPALSGGRGSLGLLPALAPASVPARP